MAFTAIAAVFTDATVSTATVLAAIGEVGTTMAVVGVVTGDSTLTKIGGVLGVAGLGGSLLAGAADSAAGGLANASGAGGVGDSADGYYGQAASAPGASGAVGATGDAASTVGGAVDPSATGSDFNDATGTLTSPNGAATQSGLNAEQVDAANPASATGATNGIVNSQMNAAPGANNALGNVTAPPATTSPTDASITNPATSTTPTASTSTPASTPAASPTTSPVGSAGAQPATSPLNNATQINNLPTAQLGSQSANLAGVTPGSVQPAQGMSDDILDSSSAQGGTPYGSGTSEYDSPSSVANGSPSNSGVLSGITNWVNQNPNAAKFYGQIGLGALSGIQSGIAAQKANQIAQGQLSIAQQKQANANSQVGQSAGIINSARSKNNTSGS